MIEVHDLFTQDVIFQERRSASAAAQGVLVVADAQALIGGERFAGRLGEHRRGLPGPVGVGG